MGIQPDVAVQFHHHLWPNDQGTMVFRSSCFFRWTKQPVVAGRDRYIRNAINPREVEWRPHPVDPVAEPRSRSQEWVASHDNGRPRAEGALLDGKPHGEWKVYRETGEQEVSGNYDKGEPIAEWKWYDKDGQTVAHSFGEADDDRSGGEEGSREDSDPTRRVVWGYCHALVEKDAKLHPNSLIIPSHFVSSVFSVEGTSKERSATLRSATQDFKQYIAVNWSDSVFREGGCFFNLAHKTYDEAEAERAKYLRISSTEWLNWVG